LYNVKTDTIRKIITLQSQADTTENYLFRYSIYNNNGLVLKGLYIKDSIEAFLNKYDLNNYLLHREKFKWISE
jgi:hypothetical protein